jgi:choice-of-anchor C domain-containing protein
MRPLFIASLLASLIAPASASNLLVNGSFENPTGVGYEIVMGGSNRITGWTTVNNGVEWFNAAGYGGAADGAMIVDLANYTYTGGGIQQSFATVVGQRYDLDFSLSTMAGYGRLGTAHFDVSVNGQEFDYDLVNHTSLLNWEHQSLSFVATATTTTLRFSNDQNPFLHFANLDGVSVQVSAVPEPATGTTLAAGLGVLALLARRRRPR